MYLHAEKEVVNFGLKSPQKRTTIQRQQQTITTPSPSPPRRAWLRYLGEVTEESTLVLRPQDSAVSAHPNKGPLPGAQYTGARPQRGTVRVGYLQWSLPTHLLLPGHRTLLVSGEKGLIVRVSPAKGSRRCWGGPGMSMEETFTPGTPELWATPTPHFLCRSRRIGGPTL